MSRNLKIWIAGASGRLGSALYRRFDRTEYDILTSDHDVPVGETNEVNRYADMNYPNVIINCSGLTDVRECERDPEHAYKVNALGARNLAIAARRIDAKLIQISTDDVFDGSASAPLNEFDAPHPITVYGKSKYAGEAFVRELTDKHVIVRSSWIYGSGTYDFVDDVLDRAARGETVSVPGDEISSPTSSDALAGFIHYLIQSKEFGLYHASCEGACSRSEFAREILRLGGYPDVPVESTVASAGDTPLRPKFTLLDNMMMRMTGIYKMPDWRDALARYLSARPSRNGGAK
ncbi:dTDP-4-dehydrorhamnose reductase [Intestinibacillus massiliensis]|uniref:dTDP-4-dehydrorhamnose reductase n=1 Tax=Intestinibacillus massiliensis TaxID=1871029 RepID=UPI000B35BDCE|nr:dTDP-4-dehydrorhamnose reductase [Intestinibacillus massiliensis]MCB6364818.1 dTDP-4-dehydrorhamnose reductase [Intestinibacillus massiliensis]